MLLKCYSTRNSTAFHLLEIKAQEVLSMGLCVDFPRVVPS